MANIGSFFLTGANGKIVVNGVTIAYATDISYRVSVKHAAPRVLGRAEVETIQPLTYDVSGTLSIIRYARGLKSQIASPPDVSNSGNGVGSFQGGIDGRADESFDPLRFLTSKMFVIEIRQKLPNIEETTVVRLRDCRFEDMSFQLSKRSAATIQLTFRARYADDDTMIARQSGAGQEQVLNRVPSR